MPACENYPKDAVCQDAAFLVATPLKISALLLLGVMTAFSADYAHAQSYSGTITLDPIPSEARTGDEVVFSGQLRTTSGHVVSDATISIKDDVRWGFDDILMTLVTDGNGRFYGTWTANPRSSGAWDFYAIYEGSSDISKSKSRTYSVTVSNYYNPGSSGSGSYDTSIKFDRIPQSIYAGDKVTFTGSLTAGGKPFGNAYVKILEDDPGPDQLIGTGWTDSNGRFSVDWTVGAGYFETDFDIYAVFDGDSLYDRARSPNQIMSVNKHGGSLTLDPIPGSARIGDVITFSGSLSLDGHRSEGAVVYIKDEDTFNPDDLLVTAYVDQHGRFSVNWFVTDVDDDRIADIYAVFEGDNTLGRLTTCDTGVTRDFGGRCSDTVPVRIFSQALPDPRPPDPPSSGEYMELLYPLPVDAKPHVAIVPSPDSYDRVRQHIFPVQEGIMMWTPLLEQRFGGSWDVSFEVISPGQLFFKSQPDIIVNLVTHDDEVKCADEYLGWAKIWPNPIKPISTFVCSTTYGQQHSNAVVSSTASHEFIHAMGLGHTFNKPGDLMCSEEDSGPTCGASYFNSETPSALNLDAVRKIYGSDGFPSPNNNISYREKFRANGLQTDDRVIDPKIQHDYAPAADTNTASYGTVHVPGSSERIVYLMDDVHILGATVDPPGTLIFDMITTADGVLHVQIPRSVLDARGYGSDADFFVLIDSEEAAFEEDVISTGRMLAIPFAAGSRTLEIIGTHTASGYPLPSEIYKDKESCASSNVKYDYAVNEVLKPGWYTYYSPLCAHTLSFTLSTDRDTDGFAVYLLPPDTDAEEFMTEGKGDYYLCEEYGEIWHQKSNTCGIEPGASLVIENVESRTITVTGRVYN